MSNEDMIQKLEHTCNYLDKVTEKLESFIQKHTVWSLYELSLITDFIKDMSTVEKNYIKSYKILNESSIERI